MADYERFVIGLCNDVNDKITRVLLLRLILIHIISLLQMSKMRAFAKYWCMISDAERKYVNTVVSIMFQQFITLDTSMSSGYVWPTDGIDYRYPYLRSINGKIIEAPCIWLFLFIEDKCNCSIYTIGLYENYFIPWLLTIQDNINTIRMFYMSYMKSMSDKINLRLCYFPHILSRFIDIQQPIINILTKLQTELNGIIQGTIPPPKNMKAIDVMINKKIQWDKLLIYNHYYTNVFFNHLITKALDDLCIMLVNLKETLDVCQCDNNNYSIFMQTLSDIVNLFHTITETNPTIITTLTEEIIALYTQVNTIVTDTKLTINNSRRQNRREVFLNTKDCASVPGVSSVIHDDDDANLKDLFE